MYAGKGTLAEHSVNTCQKNATVRALKLKSLGTTLFWLFAFTYPYQPLPADAKSVLLISSGSSELPVCVDAEFRNNYRAQLTVLSQLINGRQLTVGPAPVSYTHLTLPTI